MPVTALFLIPRRINFGPFDWKYKLFYIRIGGLALLLLLQFVGRLNRNKSSKGRASRNMFTGVVLTVVNRAAFNDKRKTRRKENVSSTAEQNEETNDQRDQKQLHFTLPNRCEKAAKTNLLFSQPVPRMLATVFGWLTDFLTGAIMESGKAARSKAVASPGYQVWQEITIYISLSK